MDMSRIKQIAEGWKNVIVKNNRAEIVAEHRLAICASCPSHSENAKTNGYKSIRTDAHCIECGCPLISKTRCLSCDCPLKKWLADDDSEKG